MSFLSGLCGILGYEKIKKHRAIDLNKSRWADDIEGHVTRDTSIIMGMYAANYGMGYLLKISDINWSHDVRERYKCTVLAEYASSWGGDSNETTVKFTEFKIDAESYTIRGLFEATIYAIENTELKKGDYPMDRGEFRKKYGLVD